MTTATTRQKYYKALTPDRKSFYDMTTQWTLNEPMPALDATVDGQPCGRGYHLGKSLEHAVSHAKFPLSLFEAEPCGALLGEDNTKARFVSARLVREIRQPIWARRAEKFLASIKQVKFFSTCGKPRKSWKMFETRDAARDAAWDAARDAARDAQLLISMEIISDLHIDKKHRKHARDRWEVWQRGYGLLCDVGEELYCYKKL